MSRSGEFHLGGSLPSISPCVGLFSYCVVKILQIFGKKTDFKLIRYIHEPPRVKLPIVCCCPSKLVGICRTFASAQLNEPVTHTVEGFYEGNPWSLSPSPSFQKNSNRFTSLLTAQIFWPKGWSLTCSPAFAHGNKYGSEVSFIKSKSGIYYNMAHKRNLYFR